jgi:hypothetical protein
VALLLAVAVLALSAAVARLGVARPDLDVFTIVIKRPGHPDLLLPGVSLGGMVIQLAINIGTFPALKLLSPAIFYRPAIGPSPAMLAVCLAVAVILTGIAALTWRNRISWHAGREQQREAELLA